MRVVKLVPHDPEWADLYGAASTDIRDGLGSTALSVEHVGSTAIPGIMAKPVIDILVLVERYDPEGAYRKPLESLGFAFGHREEWHVFFEGVREGMSIQVHVVEESAQDSRVMITFRDYLREHPDEARRYQLLKMELAQQHSDGNAYAEAKTSYVWGIVRRVEVGRADAPGT